jgi:hypothetical protein
MRPEDVAHLGEAHQFGCLSFHVLLLLFYVQR